MSDAPTEATRRSFLKGLALLPIAASLPAALSGSASSLPLLPIAELPSDMTFRYVPSKVYWLSPSGLFEGDPVMKKIGGPPFGLKPD